MFNQLDSVVKVSLLSLIISSSLLICLFLCFSLDTHAHICLFYYLCPVCVCLALAKKFSGVKYTPKAKGIFSFCPFFFRSPRRILIFWMSIFAPFDEKGKNVLTVPFNTFTKIPAPNRGPRKVSRMNNWFNIADHHTLRDEIFGPFQF